MTVGLGTVVREWGGVGGKIVGESGGVQVDEMVGDSAEKYIAYQVTEMYTHHVTCTIPN